LAKGEGIYLQSTSHITAFLPPLACCTLATVPQMDVETAIRTRRTHKAFAPEPVDTATLNELLELATWAPSHKLRNPWRFRVLGAESLQRLKDATGPEGASKLDRAPTLIAVTSRLTGNELDDEEDLLATGAAVYGVLLAAHARGLAGYWRTPGILHSPEGKAALGIPDDEHFVALIHLGNPRQEQRVPDRGPLAEVVIHLD
jgi:nitroreductase